MNGTTYPSSSILEEMKTSSDDTIIQDLIRRVWCYLVASAQHMEGSYDVLFDTIKQIVEVEPMPTMLEKWTVDAEARGKIETGRNMVLKFLRAKFHKIPGEIEDAIRQMNDSIALESLAEHAATSETIDEFAEGLR